MGRLIFKKDWENFCLNQSWIKTEKQRKEFVKDCKNLLLQAQLESRTVNGVILPEYSIDHELFDELSDVLKKVEPNLEFVVSGSSTNCYAEKGNFVLTRVWYQDDGSDLHVTNSRLKHHRWRMNRRQVETYALSAALNPKISNWWETTPIGRREIHFQRFRKKSVFSVLICEELARSDPCHDILRSVAPNLIIALLLDGPQISNRWPAQYASNLADDPGSSVLTFTSYGLIDRSNSQAHFKENHSIAMWKDDTGKIVEIPMPRGNNMRGVLLSLWSAHVVDMTITGKLSQARAWRYSSHFPISIDSVSDGEPKISEATEIVNTTLSTRAKRALVENDVHKIAELQYLLREYGERHIRERMFGIGKVTAEEILEYLGEPLNAGADE